MANLPIIQSYEPKQYPEGFVFTDKNDRFSWFWLIFGVISYPIILLIAFTALQAVLEQFLYLLDPLSLLFLLLIAVPVVMLVINFLQALQGLIAVMRLKPGQVVLSSYPLRLGESINITYRRRLRRGSMQHTGKITAKWGCHEWVRYHAGKRTETRTHTLWETQLPHRCVDIGTQMLQYESEITVSPEYPPSFYAKDNRILWELQIKVHLPFGGNDTSYFRFRVIPEVIE